MSAFLDGIGAVIGKIANWVPNKKESKLNEITRLINENAKLSQEEPLTAKSADRITNNLSRIKLLRSEAERIT